MENDIKRVVNSGSSSDLWEEYCDRVRQGTPISIGLIESLFTAREMGLITDDWVKELFNTLITIDAESRCESARHRGAGTPTKERK